MNYSYNDLLTFHKDHTECNCAIHDLNSKNSALSKVCYTNLVISHFILHIYFVIIHNVNTFSIIFFIIFIITYLSCSIYNIHSLFHY